jgi:hypothetical protein
MFWLNATVLGSQMISVKEKGYINWKRKLQTRRRQLMHGSISKRSLQFLVLAAIALASPSRLSAQSSCGEYANVTAWKGTFTLLGQGSGVGADNNYTITYDSTVTIPAVNLKRIEPCVWSDIDSPSSGPASLDVTGVGTCGKQGGSDSWEAKGTSNGTSQGSSAMVLSPALKPVFGFSPAVMMQNVTITQSGCNGSNTSTADFFVSPDFTALPAPTVPLPASPAAMSQTLNFQGSNFFGIVVPYTLTYQLTPEQLEVVIDPVDYDTFRPEANTETIPGFGSGITINAKLQYKDGTPRDTKAKKFVFQLVNVSHEPGVSMNFPVTPIDPAPADLQFTPRKQRQPHDFWPGTGSR